jgi:hypothetical protein
VSPARSSEGERRVEVGEERGVARCRWGSRGSGESGRARAVLRGRGRRWRLKTPLTGGSRLSERKKSVTERGADGLAGLVCLQAGPVGCLTLFFL